MVNNRVNPDPVLEVDINAIPVGSTSSLVISPYMFLSNILAAGASSCFTGANPSDFSIDEGNLAVTNQNTVTWANVQLDSDTTTSLTIAPKDFAMIVENDRINMTFTNLNYPIKEFGTTVGHVEIIFTGQFQLMLHTGSNGNQTLWFDVPKDQNSIINASAVMNEEYYTIEKIIGGVSIALSLLCIGGSLASSIAKRAATDALIAGGEVTAEATSAEIEEALQQLLDDPPSRRTFVNAASRDALLSLSDGAIALKNANMWSSMAKFAGWAMAFTGFLDGGMGVLASVLEKASKDQWEDTPAFSNFADLAISGYSFGGLKGLKPNSAGLAASLQIGLVAPS